MDLEIGEEIYIMRKNIYGKGNRHYQKGKVIAKYSKHFSVLFECNGGNSYRESFNYFTAKYKKELNKDDNIFQNNVWK